MSSGLPGQSWRRRSQQARALSNSFAIAKWRLRLERRRARKACGEIGLSSARLQTASWPRASRRRAVAASSERMRPLKASIRTSSLPRQRTRKWPGKPMPSTGRPRRRPTSRYTRREEDGQAGAALEHVGQQAVARVLVVLVVAGEALLDEEEAVERLDPRGVAPCGEHRTARLLGQRVELCQRPRPRRGRAGSRPPRAVRPPRDRRGARDRRRGSRRARRSGRRARASAERNKGARCAPRGRLLDYPPCPPPAVIPSCRARSPASRSPIWSASSARRPSSTTPPTIVERVARPAGVRRRALRAEGVLEPRGARPRAPRTACWSMR